MNIWNKVRTAATTFLLTAPGVALAQAGGFGEDLVQGFKGPKTPLPIAIINIVNGFLVLAAIVAAVFLILGGVQYIFSAGDSGRADTAKNTILYAILGLIVIGLAAAVTAFVSNVLLSA